MPPIALAIARLWTIENEAACHEVAESAFQRLSSSAAPIFATVAIDRPMPPSET